MLPRPKQDAAWPTLHGLGEVVSGCAALPARGEYSGLSPQNGQGKRSNLSVEPTATPLAVSVVFIDFSRRSRGSLLRSA
jgi:hypothetical protein